MNHLHKLIFDQVIHEAESSTCQGILSFKIECIVIGVCCLLGIIWAIINLILVRGVDVEKGRTGQTQISIADDISYRQKQLLLELGTKIKEGAKEFLIQQYAICLIFVAIMFLIIGFVTEEKFWTAVAFLVGALISIFSGAVGMMVATTANYRTTYCAKSSLSAAFRVAYRAGVAMGFFLVSIGLLVLLILIIVFKHMKGLNDSGKPYEYFKGLFEAIAGYGLGGSFVALFGRVGGGIYTKAADVGADLVGKVEKDLPEDSPKNPATIADNVGDNVGDVAGMSADLFGSFGQSSCAALVMSANTLLGNGGCQMQISNMMYPLMLIAIGIILCLLVSTLATHCFDVKSLDKVQYTLKLQLALSTLLIIGGTFLAIFLVFPKSYQLSDFGLKRTNLTYWQPFVCSILGLVSGLIIAIATEYVTSFSYFPVREMAQSCKISAASNVTLGLALGYMSTFVPVICIAVTAYFSHYLIGFYGVALAALGMLSNLPLSLAIDGYGPISDNAGGIAEMAEMDPRVREITDGLDAAGNTTAAIGKGFAIGSAALVSLSLYGGFIHNAGIESKAAVSLLTTQLFTGLFLGAMLPYVFSAFTIRSVSKAAGDMVEEVRRQLRQNPAILRGQADPDYKACIRISTRASLYEMIIPGLLVVVSPLLIGFAFGPQMLAGFLPGSLVSGIVMATSAANTGGAWDNTKKYIGSGALMDDHGRQIVKGSDVYKAAVVGDTVGDPLKDTSGPALNILIKLMAILSLIFASAFSKVHPYTRQQ